MTTTPAKDYTPEQWPYAGLRIDGGTHTGTKPMHAWYDPTTRTLRYWSAGRQRYTVGALYEQKISREADRVYRTEEPAYTNAGQYDNPDLVLEWEVAHEAARRRLDRLAAERKLKRQGGQIDAACHEIEELARRIKSHTELESFITSVRKRIYEAWESQ
jgi:hypothetical protein